MISPSTSVTSILLAVVLLIVPLAHPPLQAQGERPARFAPHAAGASVSASTARPAFLFTENIGQWSGGARFQGTAGSATVRFDPRGVSYCYLVDSAAGAPSSSRYHLLRTAFLDARTDVTIEGTDPTSAVSNYYLGPDRSSWYVGARGFHGVLYRGLYDGIDAHYYGRGGNLKYDFILSPGASPDPIRLRYEGARKLRVTSGGQLEATTAFGTVREAAPYCYQEVGGRRVAVEGAYRLLGDDSYGFTLGAHDPSLPVVIDPCLSVEYSTYFGGGGYDVVTSMAVDSSGFAYATGFTRAPDFPQLPDVGTVPQDNYVFISKITPDGSALVYSTLIARAYSSEYDDIIRAGSVVAQQYESIGEDVEVTRAGEAVVALASNRDSMATTTGAYRTKRSAEDINSACGPPIFPNFDTYVAKLNGSGALIWGTYIGGSSNDYVTDIALDASGDVYMTGTTYAPLCGSSGDTIDYPTTVPQGPFTAASGLPGFQTFVSRLSADGKRLPFSTLYGGNGNEVAGRIALDGSGKVYILGSTSSNNLPTTGNAYQATRAPGGGSGVYDLYIARIDVTAGALEYSSYICDGGSPRRGLGFSEMARRPDFAPIAGFDKQARHQGLVVEGSSGVVVIGGSTRSITLQTTNGAFQQFPKNSGATGDASYDAFVMRIDLNANQILGATYLSGSDFDAIGGITRDRFGDIAVAISTKSQDFPLSAVRIQSELHGTVDAAVVTLSPDLTRLTYGTFYGGSETPGSYFWEQRVYGVTADRDGAIYLYGGTSSRDFPLSQHPIQPLTDYYQGYIVKFSAPSAAKIGVGQDLEFLPNSCGTPEINTTTIFNSGQSPMRIETLKFKYGTYFSLLNPPQLPLTLQPCDTLSLVIQFDPKDLECKRTAADSLVIVAPAAAIPQAQVLVTGRRTCASVYFETTSLDIPSYHLHSEQYIGFGINVNGSTPQTITIEPDPGNAGIFTPAQTVSHPGEGTSNLAFNVNATDTGTVCESFTATIEPCGIKRKLTICARMTTGIWAATDSINYGLISCKDIDQPFVIHNTGNDILTVNVDYVTGATPRDIDFVGDVTQKIKIPAKDSATYIIPVRPKGAGKHESIVIFHTDEGAFRGTSHFLTITEELDSVAFRLLSTNVTGGFGDIIELPVDYQPILEGRIPLEELTLHANFNPKLLDIVGLDPEGALTAGWELANVSYADTGAVFKIRQGKSGRPLTGTGRLMTLKLKVLRGDTIASPFDLSLAGVSKGCLTAETDPGKLFQLSAECAQALRLLYSDRHLLKQSIPNPAVGSVTIPYMVPDQAHVTLTMYDAMGREVMKLLDEDHPAGNAEVRFNTRGLAPGSYFYRITVGDTLHETRTMVIER
jgi:hypothetical protein